MISLQVENERVKNELIQMTAKRDILKYNANQSLIMNQRMDQLNKKQSYQLYAIEIVIMKYEVESVFNFILRHDPNFNSWSETK
jgi:hypothetical protein